MMKTISAEEITRKVRIKLDEIAVNESEMMDSDADNANLDSVIKSCIAEAYRYISLNADDTMLEGKAIESPKLEVDEDLTGRIKLPSDFLRLLTIRLSSWSTAPQIVDEKSPEYLMQSNKWTCGTPLRPIVALVNTYEGRQLELYKASSKDEKVKAFVYVPSLPEKFSYVDISVQTEEAFIYYVAALTLVTFREDAADKFFKIASELLGL